MTLRQPATGPPSPLEGPGGGLDPLALPTPLDPPPVPGDLTQRGARGGAVTVAAQGAKIVIQLVSVITLARLLIPEDFGLIAMLAVFFAVADLLRDFGISTAALQARSLTEQQASNLFWLNTTLGAVLGGLLLVGAPWIAGFYDEPRLVGIAPAMAAVLLLNGLQTQVQIRLARSMRFATLAATDVAAQVLALAVAVVAALQGLGYWALVLQTATAATLLLISRGIAAKWRPGKPKDLAGTRELAVSGGHLGTAQLLSYAASNADTVAIGAGLGATELGLYNRAFQLVMAPVTQMLGPLTHVVIPVGTRATSRGTLVDTVLLRAQIVLALPAIGALATAAAVGPQAIPWLLGPQWSASAGLFVVLSLAASFTVLSTVSYWAFLLELKSKELLRYNVVTKTMTVVLVVLAAQHSTRAVAWAYTLALALSWPINLWWLHRTTPLQPRRYLQQGGLLLVAGAVAWAAGHAVASLAHDAAPLGAVAAAGGATLLVYVMALAATKHGRTGFAEVWHVARQGLTRVPR